MRYISIDLSSDNHLQQPQIFAGYAGEHNETILQVKLPKRLIDIQCSEYRCDFQTSEENKIQSPPISPSSVKNGILSCNLTEDLTIAGQLLFNVVATINNNGVKSLIAKTNMVTLHIDDSPDGNDFVSQAVKISESSNVSNALKGTKSGASVSAGDVSPLEHELKVKLKSNTITNFSNVAVSRYGKNLIPYPFVISSRELNGIAWTDNGDGTVTADGTATAQSYFSLLSTKMKLLKGVSYTLSGSVKGGAGGTYNIYMANNDYSFYKVDYGNGITFTPDEDVEASIVINIGKGTTVNNMVFKPQFEVGATPTEYEPYIAPITVQSRADGTVVGLRSLYPSFTLITDTKNVAIECTYNRDINKAFAELQQAIISLGGNT